MTWNPSQLPGQYGRVFVVTGGNAGLGYFVAEQLAATGARIVLTGHGEPWTQGAEAAVAAARAAPVA